MTIGELFYTLGFKVNDQDVNKVNNTIANIKNTATKALGMLGIGFSAAAVTGFVKDCISLSSEVEEMENKFNTVFQGMEDTVDEWAQNYATSINRSKSDIKTYLADIQNLMVGFMGTDKRQEAYELTKDMTTLALDLASFSNIDEQIAVNAMQKAVMGETEAAKTIGAVLNDVTRAEAMATLGLKGKYEALDQTNKMLVNYQAILAQSPDAIGDCVRSFNSYRSTLLGFKAALKDLKVVVGQIFMPTAQKLISFATRGVRALQTGVEKLKEFQDACQGVTKTIAILGTAFATYFVATKWKAGLEFAIKYFQTLDKAAVAARLKMIAFIAVFVMLALVVEDLIAFVQGRNSLFGELLTKAGVDVEKVRKKIVDFTTQIKKAFTAAKEFAKGLWGQLGESVKKLIPVLREFAEDRLVMIGEAIGVALPLILELADAIGGPLLQFLSEVLPLVGELASGFGTVLYDAISDLLPMLGDFASEILPILFSVLESLIPLAEKLAETILPATAEVLGAVVSVALQIAEQILPVIVDLVGALLPLALDIVESVLPVAVELLGAVLPLLSTIVETVLPVLVDLIDAALSILKPIFDIVSSLASSVLPAITEALGLIGPILEPILGLLQPIADVLSIIVTGLSNMISLVSEAVGAAGDLWASGNWNKYSAAAGEGGLSGYANGSEYTDENFIAGENGPELITGQRGKKVFTALQTGRIVSNIRNMVRGVRDAKSEVGSLFGSVAGSLNALASLQYASPMTSTVITGGSTNTRTISQNVQISNTFQGDRAIQRQAAAAMDKSAKDVTRELARGLAYAR